MADSTRRDPRSPSIRTPSIRVVAGVLLLVGAIAGSVALLVSESDPPPRPSASVPIGSPAEVCPEGWTSVDGVVSLSTVSCQRTGSTNWFPGLAVAAAATLGILLVRGAERLRIPAIVGVSFSYVFSLLWIISHLGATETVTVTIEGSPIVGRPLHTRSRRRRRRRRSNDGVGPAEPWRRAAGQEAEAAAAFAMLADDLLAADAPEALIVRARRAALEERGHAVSCAALAGIPTPPVPDPGGAAAIRRVGGRAALLELATDAYLDGCINEGAEADRLLADARAHAEAGDEATAAACRRLALDERSHAQLAWDTLLWCRQVGGPGIDLALRHTDRGLRHLLATTRGPLSARHRSAAAASRRLDAHLRRPPHPRPAHLRRPT